jgi:hypothetical protein
MSNVADVIARVTASMDRIAAETARSDARTQAYTGPERRRSRIAASQQHAEEPAQHQIDPATPEAQP